MEHDNIFQAIGGAPSVVGYGQDSNERFAHGWTCALEALYARFSAELSDDIAQELGIQ